MFNHFKFFLALLSTVVFVTSSPFSFIEEIAKKEKIDEPAESATPTEVYRLSEDVVPQSYEIKIVPKIVPDLDKFIFKGTVKINLLVQFSTNKIELHSKKLAIKSCTLDDGVQSIENKFKLDELNDLLIVETAEKLVYNTGYILLIQFEGVLGDDMTGFYRSWYTINDKEHWLAATQFEPTYARKAFPCFDEPRFRTPFSIHIAHYSFQKVVSNMPFESLSPSDPSNGFRLWTKFKTTPPMATYLVSFMISDFVYMRDDENRINVWTRKNAIQQSSYALKQSTKLLKYLEGFTGISYDLPKLDVVAIPDFRAGAMENWGMTTYKERYVIANEPTSSERHKGAITQIICHEFSHQWFGDFVTPAWWDFLWLNEGFATYFQFFGAAAVEPSWKLDEYFFIDILQPALLHEIHKQRAMTTSVKRKEDISQIFDLISYHKGASVLRMIESILSPKAFRVALHNYLKLGHEKYDGTVVPDILYKSFDKQAFRDSPPLPPRVLVSDVIKTWTENIGYPLITVTRDPKTKKTTIKQSTYKSARALKPPPDQEWIVPLSYTTKSELKFSRTEPTLWSFANKVTELSRDVPSTDWIIFNLQHSGYYRVNYDSKNWQLLIEQLHQEPQKIHILNRAQLVDDTFAFAYDEITCHHRPLQITQYLSKETELLPWLSAITHLNILLSEYEGLPVQSLLLTFISELIKKPYEHFGFRIKPTDGNDVKARKSSFLFFACKIGLEDCVKEALDEYNSNKPDIKNVQPNLKEVVYCVALRSSADKKSAFDEIWNEYLRNDIAYDKNIILSSLCCIEDDQVIKTILSKLMDSKNKEIRNQDKPIIYGSFFSNKHVMAASIEFVQNQVPIISEFDDYALTVLKEILLKIKDNVKFEEHIKLLQDLETKFLKLDNKKYGHLTEIIRDGYINAIKNNQQKNKKAEHLTSILQGLLNSDFVTIPTNTPTNVPHPSSRASPLMSSFWSNLAVAIFVCRIFL